MLYVKFTSLQVEFTSLYVEFTSLYVEFTSLQVEFTSLYVEFISLQVEFTSLYVEFTSLQVEFTSLYVEFTSLYVEFTSLQVEFTSLYVEFISLQVEFTSLYVEFISLQVEFTSLYVEFTSLQVEFTSLYVEFISLQVEFTSLCRVHLPAGRVYFQSLNIIKAFKNKYNACQAIIISYHDEKRVTPRFRKVLGACSANQWSLSHLVELWLVRPLLIYSYTYFFVPWRAVLVKPFPRKLVLLTQSPTQTFNDWLTGGNHYILGYGLVHLAYPILRHDFCDLTSNFSNSNLLNPKSNLSLIIIKGLRVVLLEVFCDSTLQDTSLISLIIKGPRVVLVNFEFTLFHLEFELLGVRVVLVNFLTPV